ncbi:MAG TPA: amidohydrolase family protein [Candidatus Paceibacterota bacterium]|nr:amidohydrolase family protein [Candidatus Paceibacterota bacterium]
MINQSLEFFDCNTYIGQVSIPRFFPERVTPEVLLGELDRIGINQALVTHVAAREYSPAKGNDLLRDELANVERLSPCLTLLPHATGELWSPDVLREELRQRGAKAVRLFPGLTLHRYPLDYRVVGELFEVLQDARVPVLVDFDLGRRDEMDWPGLYDINERYPELPMILIRPGGRSDRGLYPLLSRTKNVFVETGGYWAHRGLERICDQFGAERLVYGSGFPYWTLSGAAYHVATARISESERTAIASGNLKGILEGVKL